MPNDFPGVDRDQIKDAIGRVSGELRQIGESAYLKAKQEIVSTEYLSKQSGILELLWMLSLGCNENPEPNNALYTMGQIRQVLIQYRAPKELIIEYESKQASLKKLVGALPEDE